MNDASAMEMLAAYLRETRTSAAAFAKIIGIDAAQFGRIMAGDEPVDATVARRIVDASGGALLLGDLTNAQNAVVDFRQRFASEADDIEVATLAEILATILPVLLGGGRRKGDDRLPALVAEAVAHTYLALSTVTTRRGADRLVQALRPVFAEILSESGAAPAPDRLDHIVRQAADLYVQALDRKRRA